ncbi:MAG TPA: tripartite tricarboxylate transporter TctB family protein [Xanthobacteraceae bacterium]|nr:tripartite tricarboxylate transporter TctB family protein [Xanthobacteraceae bacterium]
MDGPKPRYAVDWGHLVFLAVIAVAVSWYLFDAMSVSLNIHNLLLVAPLAVLALGLCIIIVPQCFHRQTTDAAATGEKPRATGTTGLRPGDKKNPLLIGAVAVSLGLYVSLLNIIGFDIATCLVVLAVMLICGERRPIPLIVYPVIVALVLVAGFRALLPYPMYTIVI